MNALHWHAAVPANQTHMDAGGGFLLHHMLCRKDVPGRNERPTAQKGPAAHGLPPNADHRVARIFVPWHGLSFVSTSP